MSVQPGNIEELYLELICRFPLRPIHSDEQLRQAIAVIDSLLSREPLAPEEKDYLEVLSDLVERYESEKHPMTPVPDAVMLRHLIEAKGISQTQLASATGIVHSTIREVLSGKRTLSRSHIGKLAKYFNVEPGVFAFDG